MQRIIFISADRYCAGLWSGACPHSRFVVQRPITVRLRTFLAQSRSVTAFTLCVN